MKNSGTKKYHPGVLVRVGHDQWYGGRRDLGIILRAKVLGGTQYHEVILTESGEVAELTGEWLEEYRETRSP